MSGMQRRKGRKGEQQVARLYREQGIDAARVPNSGSLDTKGDLVGVPGVHVEVKMAGTLHMADWVRQAEREAPAGDIPAVHWRLCRRGNSTGWNVSLPLDDFIALLQRASL